MVLDQGVKVGQVLVFELYLMIEDRTKKNKKDYLGLPMNYVTLVVHGSPYSSVLNRRLCTFISGKVCLLNSIEAKKQNLPEISVQGHLFRTLEYGEP